MVIQFLADTNSLYKTTLIYTTFIILEGLLQGEMKSQVDLGILPKLYLCHISWNIEEYPTHAIPSWKHLLLDNVELALTCI